MGKPTREVIGDWREEKSEEKRRQKRREVRRENKTRTEKWVHWDHLSDPRGPEQNGWIPGAADGTLDRQAGWVPDFPGADRTPGYGGGYRLRHPGNEINGCRM